MTDARRDTTTPSVGSGGGATAVADRDPRGVDPHDVDGDLDRELDLAAHDDLDAVDDRPTVSRERVLDRRAETTEADDQDRWDDHDGWDDADDLEPRSYRPGRGGFDPEAAEVAAHARYAFRQRVALGLIAVAVLSALAALVVTPVLWWLHVVTDLVLVGYLVFLRRQTRIEEEVRARRAARLSGERQALEARRERQAAHDDLMAVHRREAEDWGGHPGDDDAPEDGLDDVDDHEFDVHEVDGDAADDVDDAAPRWAAPRTPAPPVPDGLELVDDSDDDPAFHELDGRDCMPSYRRAAAGA